MPSEKLDCIVNRAIKGGEKKGKCTLSKEELHQKLIARSPTASIEIGGIEAKCILDTGAETSLISSTFYHQCLAKKVGQLAHFKLLKA